MDFEQGKAIYGAKQVGDATVGVSRLLFTKLGLLFFIGTGIYLESVKPFEPRKSEAEIEQERIVSKTEHCVRKQLRIAVSTDTLLPKTVYEDCRQKAIAALEDHKAYLKRQEEFSKSWSRRAEKVLRESQQ